MHNEDEWVIARRDSEEPLSEEEWLLAARSDPEFEMQQFETLSLDNEPLGAEDCLVWTAHPDGEARAFDWDESDGHVIFVAPDEITLAKAHGLAAMLNAEVCELRPSLH